MPDTKITALTAIGANPINVATFPIPMVDLTDTSMAASGTTKKVTVNQILGAGGTATLASATITGDLTVDTSTLKVDSTNNRVGIGTASPTVPLYVTGNNATATAIMQDETNGAKLRLLANSINFDISNGGGGGDIAVSGANPFTFRTNGSERYRIASDGVATWSNVGGVAGTAMTLNSTGLGIGLAPVGGVKLSVAGTIYANAGNALILDNPSSNFVAQIKNTGSSLQSTLAFLTGSGTSMLIDNSGNVGIGVTPTTIVGASGANGKGLQGDSWTISSLQGLNESYLGNNLYSSAYNVWSNRVNAASGAYYITGGTHIFLRGAAQAPGTITPTESARIDASGNLILQPSSTPPSLFANGQLTMNATSNTNLRFSYRGSDGVTRVANITLA